MEIDENIIEFLNREDVQEALANNDIQTLYVLTGESLGRAMIRSIARILTEAGVDPLRGMTEIPDYFLYFQRNITKFNIPEGITKIGYGAFEYTELESIYIPDSVKEISSWAFYEARSLKEVKLPRGVVLGYCCFASSGLESIELEDVRFNSGSFGQFNNCKNLKSAILKGNIDVLPKDLFNSCFSLTHVELPAALKAIKSDVFDSCPELSKIYFEGTAEQWKQIAIGKDNAGLFSCKIICNDSALRFDKKVGVWVEV